MRAAFVKALRLKMTCCSLPSFPAQAPAAKTVLDQTLPHGYVVAPAGRDNETITVAVPLAGSSRRTVISGNPESITHFGDFIV